MNAVKNLINSKIKNKGFSRSELARSLGYTNISKGLRKFDNFINTGNEKPDFINNLLNILEINMFDYEKAVVIDEIDRENSERQRFVPYIDIIIVKGGMPIVSFAMLRAQCIVKINEMLNTLPADEEISKVIQIYSEYLKSSTILSMMTHGFRYQRTYDECWIFNQDCHLIERKFGHMSPCKVEISVGGRVIPSSLLLGKSNHEVKP